MLSRRRSTFSQKSQRSAKPCFPSAAEGCARGDDRFDGVVADVLDGGEAEADSVGGGGEVGVRGLDIGREDVDVDLAALGDVLDDVLGLGGFAGEQRGHELDGVVGLEPGGVIGEQGVGGGVTLVEAVAGELGHEVEDLAGDVFGMLVGGGSGHEALALFAHLGGVLFAHGAAQEVGFAECVAGDGGGDLHDLLLVDHDAEGLLEDDFHLGQVVLDGAAAPLALDEVIDHGHGAGTIEGVEGGEVFDAVGLVAAENVAHAAGLELEDAGGEGAVEDLLVDLGVVERDEGHVDRLTAIALDELEAVVDDGEGGEAEKVHLEKAHLLDGLHVVGGDDGFVFGARYRHQLGERLWRDDDAGGVDAGAANEALKAQGGVDEFLDRRSES